MDDLPSPAIDGQMS